VKPNLRAKLEFKPFVHSWPAVVTVESFYGLEKVRVEAFADFFLHQICIYGYALNGQSPHQRQRHDAKIPLISILF
jgi:hypothetical protein